MTQRLMIRLATTVGVAAFLLTAACSTVTLRSHGTTKLSTEPTWSQSESFFLWGLVGNHHVDVDQVCSGQRVDQMQAQTTFMNGFLNVLTAGIYCPRTAKVWCD